MVSVRERDEGEEELSVIDINPPLAEEEILVKVHCSAVKEMEGKGAGSVSFSLLLLNTWVTRTELVSKSIDFRVQ